MAECSKFLPPSCALVNLIEPPRGSYARPGVYRVTYAPSCKAGKRGIWATSRVQLWDEARQLGTYDNAIFWAWARFHVLQA